MKTNTPPPPALGYRLMLWAMCPALKLMGISCRHFATLCTERLDRPLTASETLRLRFHGLMCHVCRPLPKQFENLRRLTRCCCGHAEPEHMEAELSSEAHKAIRDALQKESHQSDDL